MYLYNLEAQEDLFAYLFSQNTWFRPQRVTCSPLELEEGGSRPPPLEGSRWSMRRHDRVWLETTGGREVQKRKQDKAEPYRFLYEQYLTSELS